MYMRPTAVLCVEPRGLREWKVQERLNLEGWFVETCHNGFDALERLESRERYDVILIEDFLDGVNGVELVKYARRLAHRHNTPIIMMSWNEGEEGEEIRGAREAGADEVLVKPEDVELVVEIVTRVLNRGRSGDGGTVIIS